MLKKKIFRFTFLMIIIIFASTGCKTYQYFTIDILEPAEIFLPGNIEKLLVTSNTFSNTTVNKGTKFIIYGQSVVDSAYRDSTLAAKALGTLTKMLDEIGKVTAIIDDSAGIGFPDKPGDYTESHVSLIRQLCKQNNADAFLILTSISKEIVYDIYYGDFGNTYGEFQLMFSTRWLLIDPYSSKLIDNKIIYDTLYLPVSKPFSRNDQDNYNSSIALLLEATELAAIEYGSYISPHYSKSDRMIFVSGNKALKKGYQKAKTGNWKDAAIFWRDALTVPDDKIRAQASFNLALANEMEGLLEPALEWVKESYRFFPDTINLTYIDILKERIEDQKAIVLQMEGR